MPPFNAPLCPPELRFYWGGGNLPLDRLITGVQSRFQQMQGSQSSGHGHHFAGFFRGEVALGEDLPAASYSGKLALRVPKSLHAQVAGRGAKA